MINLNRIKTRTILSFLVIFNVLILILYIIYIFSALDIISNTYFVFIFPIFYISKNWFFVFLFLLAELFILFFCWIKQRNEKKLPLNNLLDTTFNKIINKNESFSLNSDIDEKNNLENKLNLNNLSDLIQNESQASILSKSNSIESNRNYAYNLLTNNDECSAQESINCEQVTTIKSDIVEDFPRKLDVYSKNENSFYQTIDEQSWIYEKISDREKIGINKKTLEEIKVTSTVIKELLESKKIFKLLIKCPYGSFYIYSSDLNVEKLIIKEIINNICIKIGLKIINRKYYIKNWLDLGLLHQNWIFDIEVQIPHLICMIIINSYPSRENLLFAENKNSLKALFLVSELKFSRENIPLIVTNSEDNQVILKNYLTQTGWGKYKLLNFTEESFEFNFINSIFSQ